MEHAVLLYCSPEFKEHLLPRLGFGTYIDATVSQTVLRNLDEAKEGRFQLLVTDDPVVGLRGIDLRSFLNGVKFITMKSFVHQREMIQAASRVGRGGDKCERILLGDIELIDHMADCAYQSRLLKFVESVHAQHAPKGKSSLKMPAVKF